jgi:hypothetical protein
MFLRAFDQLLFESRHRQEKLFEYAMFTTFPEMIRRSAR